MHQSFLLWVWDAVKPPPPLPARFNRAQRRLLRVTAIVLGLGAGAWGLYAWIASAPDRALNHFTEGNKLLGPADFKGAAAQFTKAIQIDPNFAEAYRARGDAWQAAGQSDAALADFAKAISIDPAEWMAYLSRGMLWSERGDTQRAIADFTQSIHLHPTAKTYYRRGLAYQALADAKNALADYNLAIERDPSAPYVYLARARAKRESGDLSGAAQDQETAERLGMKQ
jgi:tetratricopeptide (TPR) repeat protein